MSLPAFRACVAGYEDRLLDQRILATQAGHWAGYYSRAKKPKPLERVLQGLYDAHSKITDKTKKHRADTVDVEGFLEQEKRFKQRMEAEGYVRR